MALLARRPGRLAAALIASLLAICPAVVLAHPHDFRIHAASGAGRLADRLQETLENDVKAAFLYNFTKFVEWPQSGGRGNEPFRICVLADPVFVRTVDRIIEGESIQGRRLVRTEPQTVDDARACNILYVGRSEAERGARMMSAVRQLPVLTVGDTPKFVDQGGAIGFVLENDRVRFDVSAPAVDRAGLKVSSKLLRVARNVKDNSPTQ